MPLLVKASNRNSSFSVEMSDNGYYYETIIEDTYDSRAQVPNLTEGHVTKTKTVQMKNSSGNVLWSVSITATFYYNGTTAICTNCTPSANSYHSTWTIKNLTSSRNGNSATAKAVATQTLSSGDTLDITKSVTIKCSPIGVVS